MTTARERAAWASHAEEAIARTGLRAGGARTAVVDLLARQDCCLSAQEIHAALGRNGCHPAMASVYRALDTLTDLGLVHKVDLGGSVARFEPAHPDGDHHHHAVCRECGTVVPINDSDVERAIHGFADRLSFDVESHDITLRGRCARCTASP
ncbi:MAG: transcriptional repressor [Thermoleophilia bacterium]|nr:transcriptional repressor [Thermoleophilia bacterium]